MAVLSRDFDFDGKLLCEAIRATFERRGTPIPMTTPVALTSAFVDNAAKLEQWSGFVRKAGVNDMASLAEAVQAVALFLAEPVKATAHGERFGLRWTAGGPWGRLSA